MTLAALQHGLAQVRRRRMVLRLGAAGAGVLTAALWVLAAAFGLDYALHMGRLERSIILLASVVAAGWAWRRRLRPSLRVHEDDVTLALQVERRQGLASDLVAALQFADGQRPQFGSGDLRQAVINYTDEAARGFDFLEGFSRRELSRRLAALTVTLALVAGPAALYPGHTAAFLARFFLGGAHYPTRTVLRQIASPGPRAAYGRPVVFRVRIHQTRGARPEKGVVQLRALSSGLSTAIDLLPDRAEPDLYTGQLNRALDDLSYTLAIGDAYTEPAVVKLIPLPLVKVDLRVTVPEYAAAKFKADSDGLRQRVVLEGAAVVPVVTADKKLVAATMTLAGKAYPLRRDGERFLLDQPDSPLAAVSETLRYELQVTDEDGLSLEAPVAGLVQVRPDQPPRIGAAAVSRFVLPTATPVVRYSAVDDYGLAKIVLHRSVTRSDGKQEESEQVVAAPAEHPLELGRPNPVALPVALADLKLAAGDRVTVTLEAIDWRGSQPGKATRSESISFQVTDRAGVLAAMRELDEQMDKKLDDIIKAQLGLGG